MFPCTVLTGGELGVHTNFPLLYLHKLLQTGLNRLVFKSYKEFTSTEHSNHQERTNRTLAASNWGGGGAKWRAGLGLKVREFMFPNLFYSAFPYFPLLAQQNHEPVCWYPDRTALVCIPSFLPSAWNSFLISLLPKTCLS